MNECKHLSRIGDNYGESCQSCGAQLSGYGYGGWFGSNLTGKEVCIHLFAPMGEPGSAEICIYCEELKPAVKAPLKIKPRSDCKACHGSGEVFDSVDYGSTTASLVSFCDCVLEQIPEGREDEEIELDLSEYHSDRDEKRASDAFDDWNAGERPAHWL